MPCRPMVISLWYAPGLPNASLHEREGDGGSMKSATDGEAAGQNCFRPQPTKRGGIMIDKVWGAS
jgi:hypothetical protein